jgi:hypothetical protein|tara:strand:- start:1479 stop:2135 length:657 start_codon:yes stop_codon:yes gene_type:complete
MATNYTTLKTNIQTWAQNTGTDFTAQLDTFITNAQQELIRLIDPEQLTFHAFSTFNANTQFLTTPNNTLIVKSLQYTNSSNERVMMEIQTNEFIREYWPNPSLTGEPKYFANYNDGNVLIAPTPVSNYTVYMEYIQNIADLSANNPTNYLTDSVSDLLLYACLAEAAVFTKSLEDYSIYKSKVTESVASLNNEARRRRRTDYKFPASPAGTDTLTGGQ